MRNRAILFTMFCIITSCGIHTDTILPKYEGVKLIIDTQKNTTDNVIIIDVSLVNNTMKDFYVLTTGHAWTLDIFFQDTIKMEFPYLVNYGVRQIKDSYVLIKSGQTYTFHNSVDFRELCHKCPVPSKLNTDYGKYSIKLTYYDYFRGRIKALKGRVESNVLTVTYEP